MDRAGFEIWSLADGVTLRRRRRAPIPGDITICEHADCRLIHARFWARRWAKSRRTWELHTAINAHVSRVACRRFSLLLSEQRLHLKDPSHETDHA